MYREQILCYAKTNEYVNPKQGASLKSIKNAESTINCIFPDELRDLLLEMNGDDYLFFSVDEIIEKNIETRKILGEYYKGLDSLLFFAGNGCGDYYCYKILPSGFMDSKSIYIWMHEDNKLECVVHNLTELINRYFNNEI